MTYRLGRLVEHDPRSRNFPVRGLLQALPRRSKRWRRGWAYDQGQTSMCVAETVKGMLNTAPWSGFVPYDTRASYDVLDLYEGARRNDEYEGEDYDGTSALGALKYARDLGWVKSYEWCFGIDDVLDHLVQRGAVGLGANWYESMFEPDPKGLLTIAGDVAGGHETELIGIDVIRREVVGMNSWGTGWGVNGRYRLSWDDLDRLLCETGDATAITML